MRDVFTHRTPERLAAHAADRTEPASAPPGPHPPAAAQTGSADPAPAAGEEFTDLLDAGEMDQLHQLWNTQD